MGDYKGIKVLMTTDTVGGVWTYTIELCRALTGYDVTFFLVTMGDKLNACQKEEVNALENAEVFETTYALEWMHEPWKDIDASGQWLLELEQKLSPDIIHLNCYTYGSLPWQAPVLMIAHSDVFSWWHAVHGHYPADDWQEYYRRVKAGILEATCLVAPSIATMRNIQDIYHAGGRKKVIYNARTTQPFRMGKKEPYAFSAGRLWDEAKNIGLVLKAASHIPYPVKIAGAVHKDENLNLPGNVQYMGRLSAGEIACELAKAAVYVLPARYEPFGLSVLEAALSGCALVLGNIDSLNEIWEDNALYVDVNDEAALAGIVNRLLTDRSLRMQYARKAYTRAQLFTTKAMAEQYLEIYTQLQQEQQNVVPHINVRV